MSAIAIVPCSSCGSLNRVPRERFGDGPICADCQAPLIGAPPANLDDESFDRFVENSDLPVVVDFWAVWCSPCQVMAPSFAEASARLGGRALLAKVDTDQSQALGTRFNIMSIPTLVLLDKGQEVARQSGLLSTDDIERWVTSHA